MKYQLLTTRRFDKAFSKLDRPTQVMIKAWIEKNLLGCDNPRVHGKPLAANKTGYWRYRIGNYRIIADIQDDKVLIVLIEIGHRREIYNR
jgi:mRNA interferase RelE/StbE